jgi:hypothetical protein
VRRASSPVRGFSRPPASSRGTNNAIDKRQPHLGFPAASISSLAHSASASDSKTNAVSRSKPPPPIDLAKARRFTEPCNFPQQYQSVYSSSRRSTDRFRFFNNLRFGSNPLGARGLCTAAYRRARAIVVQSAAVDGELDCESRARIGRAVLTSALALATAMLVLAVATLIGNSGGPPILDRDAPPLPHSKPPERRTTPRALTNPRLRRV